MVNTVNFGVQPPNFNTGALGPISNVYFNGFALGLAPADVSLLVTFDGQPQLKLSMSFTTAKTLSSYFVELIQQLEDVTDHDIMKTDEVERGLKRLEEKRSLEEHR